MMWKSDAMKAAGKAVSVIGGLSGVVAVVGFGLTLATKEDLEKARKSAAPANLVQDVKSNTTAINKLDKEAAVRDVIVNSKLDALLAAQAEQVRRNPRRRRQMAKSIEQVRRKAASAGVKRDPRAGIEVIQEVAGDAGTR